ncbi:MAG: hypothetical protein SFY68_01135 [Candidatus Sumerlaeia bacterium]|nr:hypothetical protein [Candidatus Sumerlaeia bacterium]
MKTIVIVVLALLIGILATILTTDSIGATSIFSGKGKRGSGLELAPGQILVPFSRGDLPAYEKVGIEDLAMIPVDEKNISGPAPIMDASKINGRILKSNKAAGRYFIEDDFMPVGTAEGIAGATTPGKRGLIIRADKITGVYGMKAGDTFDLLLTVNGSRVAGGATSSILGSVVPSSGGASQTIVVVNNGRVLRPVSTRMESREVRRGMIGAQTETQQFPIDEIAIEVAPEEVPTLTAAIASNSELLAVVRSGQIGADADQGRIIVPSYAVQPASEVKIEEAPKKMEPQGIDVITGTNRSVYQYQPATANP